MYSFRYTSTYVHRYVHYCIHNFIYVHRYICTDLCTYIHMVEVTICMHAQQGFELLAQKVCYGFYSLLLPRTLTNMPRKYICMLYIVNVCKFVGDAVYKNGIFVDNNQHHAAYADE